MKDSVLILDESQIMQKIKRIAYEIYENNYYEEEIIIAGIIGAGYSLAQLLVKELNQISPFRTSLIKVTLNKEEPLKSSVELDQDVMVAEGKCVIMIDDVLNTGRTFLQSLKPFLDVKIKKIQTATLVNRSHKLYPISADYTGYELSTTINERIKVSLEPGSAGVYLY